MYIQEFLRSKAEDFTKKFKKAGIPISVYSENGLYVVQIPECDSLYVNSKKFRNWKNELEKECSAFLDEAFVLVTDVYSLGKTFKKIY